MSVFQPTILVTGFEPFCGYEKNVSIETVSRLPDEIGGCRIIKEELPVVWIECTKQLERYMEEYQPRAVLSFGQGYPKPPVQIERLAVNLCCGPDNSGVQDMHDQPIFYGGPNAYFATIPYEAMGLRLRKEGIDVAYSYDCGQNQCNGVLYSALHFAATRFPGTVAGFIHLPMLEEQSPTGLPQEILLKAATCLVEEVAKSLTKMPRTFEEYFADL